MTTDSEIQRLLAAITDKLDGHTAALDRIDARLDSIEKHSDSIANHVEQMQLDLAEQGACLGRIERRLGINTDA